MMDLSKLENRRKLIGYIKSDEEKYRKEESLRQTEVYNDRVKQYVDQLLRRKYSESTVNMMTQIASINLCRRVVNEEASLYKNTPEREFTDLSEDQEAAVRAVYSDSMVDSKLCRSNQSFKLQQQNHVMIMPHKGMLKWRVLRNHHLTTVPDQDNPEEAWAYIISGFDKQEFLEDTRSNTGTTLTRTDGINEKYGDTEDYKAASERHVVWTPEYHFKMDGRGNLIGESQEDISNQLGVVPIFEVSIEKDFEYWVRQGATLVDFTIEYNCAWSAQQQINEMQGFSQAVLIGEADTENFTVGPNHILNLKPGHDESGNPVNPDFKFVSPSPDLRGSFEHIQGLLANFLSSRGLNPKMVSGTGDAEKFTSGLDRLLSMIDRFEATKEDVSAFTAAEKKQYKIVKAWINALRDTPEDEGGLKDKYRIQLPEESEVQVTFAGPEMVETESEKISNAEARRDASLASILDNIMDYYNFESREQAEEKLSQIVKDEEQYREMTLGESSRPSEQ